MDEDFGTEDDDVDAKDDDVGVEDEVDDITVADLTLVPHCAEMILFFDINSSKLVEKN